MRTVNMSEMEDPKDLVGSSLRDFYRVLFRRRGRMLLCFVAIVGLTTIGTLLWPESYQSDAKLLVRIGRESVTLDPTASTGQVLTIHQARESEINSELEILTSRELAEKVVDAVGPEVIAGPGLLQRLGLPSGADPRERAVEHLMEGLNVEVLKDTNIITLSYRARSPDLAQRVVGKLIDLYLDKHIAAHRTTGSYEFFSQEADKLRGALAQTEARLRDLKNKTNVGALDEQRRILLDRIGAVQQEIQQTNTGLSASAAKVAEMQRMLPDLPQTVVTQQTSGFPNTAADGMRQKLYELQLKEQDLLSKFNETSAPVVEIRRQITQAQELLKHEEEKRTQVTEGLNMAYQQVKANLLVEQAALSALKAKGTSLTGELSRARGELKALNDTEVELAQLERQLATERESYKKYSSDLEQARIDRALEIERISNISVVQAATLVSVPVSPRNLLNIILGFVLGLFGSTGVAFLAEYLDHSMTEPVDVEARLQLPTLVAIPRLPAEPLRQALAGGGSDAATTAIQAGTGRVATRKSLLPAKIDTHFEALRDHLAFTANGHLQAPCVLAVTSSRQGEGVSTVSAALALTFGRETQGPVLLVDLKNLRVTGRNGHLILAGMEVGAGGALVSRDLHAYESMTMGDALDALRGSYRYVVLDTPAVLETTAVARVCSLADGVVLVVEAETTRWEVAQQAKEVLKRANAKVLGVVLNKRQFHVPGWLYRRI